MARGPDMGCFAACQGCSWSDMSWSCFTSRVRRKWQEAVEFFQEWWCVTTHPAFLNAPASRRHFRKVGFSLFFVWGVATDLQRPADRIPRALCQDLLFGVAYVVTFLHPQDSLRGDLLLCVITALAMPVLPMSMIIVGGFGFCLLALGTHSACVMLYSVLAIPACISDADQLVLYLFIQISMSLYGGCVEYILAVTSAQLRHCQEVLDRMNEAKKNPAAAPEPARREERLAENHGSRNGSRCGSAVTSFALSESTITSSRREDAGRQAHLRALDSASSQPRFEVVREHGERTSASSCAASSDDGDPSSNSSGIEQGAGVGDLEEGGGVLGAGLLSSTGLSRKELGRSAEGGSPAGALEAPSDLCKDPSATTLGSASPQGFAHRGSAEAEGGEEKVAGEEGAEQSCDSEDSPCRVTFESDSGGEDSSPAPSSGEAPAQLRLDLAERGLLAGSGSDAASPPRPPQDELAFMDMRAAGMALGPGTREIKENVRKPKAHFNTQRLILEGFQETPQETIACIVDDALSSMNSHGRGCCDRHILVIKLKRYLSRMLQVKCQPDWRPYSSFQCNRCHAMNEDYPGVDDARRVCEVCGSRQKLVRGRLAESGLELEGNGELPEPESAPASAPEPAPGSQAVAKPADAPAVRDLARLKTEVEEEEEEAAQGCLWCYDETQPVRGLPAPIARGSSVEAEYSNDSAAGHLSL